MHDRYHGAIQRFEGFTAQAKWDYAQHSNGFGTKAQFPGEVIGREEAERRFSAELASAATLVERFAPGLEPGTKAALASLTFNAGPRWMSAGLGSAILNGDLDTAREIFLTYTKAGGESLPGLVARRLEEAAWFSDLGEQGSAPAGTVAMAALAAQAETAADPAQAVNAPPASAEKAQAAPESAGHVRPEALKPEVSAAFWEAVRRDNLHMLLLAVSSAFQTATEGTATGRPGSEQRDQSQVVKMG